MKIYSTWMRKLQIILTSQKYKKQKIFGGGSIDDNQLTMNISGYKYLSSLKDNFRVQISNVTYKDIVEIIGKQYFEIEIKAGYYSSKINTIFKGYIIYVSNDFGDMKTTNLIITCGSRLVALYGQSRMNLGLHSGINMFAALKFVCKRAGIKNSNIDSDFKYRLIQESTNVNQTIGSYVDSFINNNNYLVQSDSSLGADITIWDPYRKDKRFIKLTNENIQLIDGKPKMSSDGLHISIMVSYNFLPGDVIQIDNSIIDLGIQSKEEAFENRGYFLDKNGEYMIYQISYNLENRGDSFNCDLLCKSRDLISKITNTKGGIK